MRLVMRVCLVNLEPGIMDMINTSPMVHSLDLVVSMTVPRVNEDPIVPMKRFCLVALSLAVVLFTLICRLMLCSPGTART